jgi:hypothetical protein
MKCDLLPNTSNHILIACSSCSLYTFESDTDKESCFKNLGFYNETILIYHKPNTTVILLSPSLRRSFVPQSGKICTCTQIIHRTLTLQKAMRFTSIIKIQSTQYVESFIYYYQYFTCMLKL